MVGSVRKGNLCKLFQKFLNPSLIGILQKQQRRTCFRLTFSLFWLFPIGLIVEQRHFAGFSLKGLRPLSSLQESGTHRERGEGPFGHFWCSPELSICDHYLLFMFTKTFNVWLYVIKYAEEKRHQQPSKSKTTNITQTVLWKDVFKKRIDATRR